MKRINTQDIYISNNDELLKFYTNDIRKYKVLSKEDEVLYFNKYKQGDTLAREIIFKSNLRFVVTVAKRYKGYYKSLDINDLINEGNIGLSLAIDKFDHTKGYRFISYAVWWIQQHIVKIINTQKNQVQLPSKYYEKVNKILKFVNKYNNKYGFEPSIEVMEEELGIDRDVIYIVLSDQKDVSLQYENDEGNTFIELPNEEEVVDNIINKNHKNYWLNTYIKTLTAQEEMVLKMHFGLDEEELSLVDISNRLSLSTERIRQIKENGLRRLRFKFNRKRIKNF